MTTESERFFKKSLDLIPGGVNSPVRSFAAVGGTPFLAARGEGAQLFDIDGRDYVDYVMSWGPLILGHSYKPIVEAIVKAARHGTSFGAPTKNEMELALLVRERMPWIEKLRLVSSGTEACMTAARLARAATGRNIIVKFDGCYHGHSDAFLVKAGSGLATGGLPASAGVPDEVTANTISLPYNNIQAAETCFKENGKNIAAVIIEPIAANMGVIPPVHGFLHKIRELCDSHGSILIFDELITGFRVTPGGAAQLFDIKPDLICLGKILGGGLPLAALGGKAEIMDYLAPRGPVYQAGTLSGNPLSTAAGIAILRALADPDIYTNLRQYAIRLASQIAELFAVYEVPVCINRIESLFSIFFSDVEVKDYSGAQQSDMKLFAKFFHKLLSEGIFIPPSGFEAWFISTAHTPEDLKSTVKAIEHFLIELKSENN